MSVQQFFLIFFKDTYNSEFFRKLLRTFCDHPFCEIITIVFETRNRLAETNTQKHQTLSIKKAHIFRRLSLIYLLFPPLCYYLSIIKDNRAINPYRLAPSVNWKGIIISGQFSAGVSRISSLSECFKILSDFSF